MPDKALVLDFSQPVEVDRRVSLWRGYRIEYSSLPLPASYDFRGNNESRHYLAYHDLILKEGEMEIEGEAAIRGADLRGKMTFIPQGRSFQGWATPKVRKNSFTTITFAPNLINEELEMLYTGVEQEPLVYFQSEMLKSSMQKLESMLKLQEAPTALYIETLGLTAILETSMVLSESRGLSLKKGALSKSQMTLVADYIKARLTQDMTLEELANVACMSRFHFSRSFKASFGESPIRYINRERVAMARKLLEESRQPIAEIASFTGFGTNQNFLKIFKNYTGMTPSDFRRKS